MKPEQKLLLKLSEQNLVHYKSDTSQDKVQQTGDYYEDLIGTIKSPIELKPDKLKKRRERIKCAAQSCYALGSVKRVLQTYKGR